MDTFYTTIILSGGKMCAFSILIVKRANSISRILSSKRVETGKKKSITSYLCDLKWRRWGRCFLSLGAIKCHLDSMITQTTGELNDSLEDLKRSLDRNLLAKENWHHLFLHNQMLHWSGARERKQVGFS